MVTYGAAVRTQSYFTLMGAINLVERLEIRQESQASSNAVKANWHIPCRALAVPLPCRAALIHKCRATPLPFPIVKVRMVTGNIRTASPTV
jgi:hypothetical protein